MIIRIIPPQSSARNFRAMPQPKRIPNSNPMRGENYAYLKIGEGCSNRCTYCAIPYIRGTFVSRKMEDILEETKILAQKGIKEIIVIAQDTTKYGIDIYGESKLAELLHKISEIPEIMKVWFPCVTLVMIIMISMKRTIV